MATVEYGTRWHGIAIPAPVVAGLTVTVDGFGGGVNDDGVPYATFDIKRPDTASRFGAMLASITVYADTDIPAIVWDRYTGDARAGDLTAIQRVRDMLARDYPTARSASYRYA